MVVVVVVIIIIIIIILLLCSFLVDSGRIFGLVYSPWEQVTSSHNGSQVSLFLLLTGTLLSSGTLLFLVSLLFPTVLFSG